jgi:release factor glutamine methyltransferase
MQIKEAYQQLLRQLSGLYERGEAASIARIFFEDALGIANVHRPGALGQEQTARLEEASTRLLRGEPLQYVLGQADFYGLKLQVDARVLIPRQETEELVHWVLAENDARYRSLLDIGTGSGCIPIALKKHRPAWQISALDISTAALELAAENARANDLEVAFIEADILEASAWPTLGQYDLIVSNPPYIPPSEAQLMPPWVLQHEPYLALFVEERAPLLFYEAIADFARAALCPAGYLFFELNEHNANQVAQLLDKKGFVGVEVKRDLNGKERMARGRWEAERNDLRASL